ncbi:MAG: OpgC domain-containing protein, partial [Acidobacteriota bacterium]
MQIATSYSNLRIKPPMELNEQLNARWAYPAKDKRDLRLDFMRGLIMVYVVVVHIECYSLFSLFAWERLGIISSAEGFVFLSGLVAGLVYGKRA